MDRFYLRVAIPGYRCYDGNAHILTSLQSSLVQCLGNKYNSFHYGLLVPMDGIFFSNCFLSSTPALSRVALWRRILFPIRVLAATRIPRSSWVWQPHPSIFRNFSAGGIRARHCVSLRRPTFSTFCGSGLEEFAFLLRSWHLVILLSFSEYRSLWCSFSSYSEVLVAIFYTVENW